MLIAIGLIGYFATGLASLTALVPAMLGAVMLVLALAARSPDARKHAMYIAVAFALVSVLGTVARLFPAVMAREFERPAVVAQAAMVLVLAFYLLLSVKSFIDARRARRT